MAGLSYFRLSDAPESQAAPALYKVAQRSTGLSAASPIDAVLWPLDAPVTVWHTAQDAPLTLTYRFESSLPGDRNWDSYPGFTPLTSAQRAVVRTALGRYADVINVRFSEAGSVGDADLSFGRARLGHGGQGQFFYNYRTLGGVVTSRELDGLALFDTSRSLDGASGMSLVLHEIGHTLTLKHTGNYDVGGGTPPSPFLPAKTDNNKYTVMSYNSEPATGQSSPWPGLYDVAALQRRFGANLETGAGNTVYRLAGDGPRVIWDAGGIDTLSLGSATRDLRLDLRAGHFSSIHRTDDVAVAYGAVIENAVAGSGADLVVGTGRRNVLRGGGGNDTLTGGRGNDQLSGGSGSDVAVVTGSRADYTATRLADGGVRLAGPDGSDTLTGIERVRFGGTTVTMAALLGDRNRTAPAGLAGAPSLV